MLHLSAKQITDKDGTTDIAVASTATIYCKSEYFIHNQYTGLWLKATSEGTVDVAVWIEESYRLPKPEGVADSDWVVPETSSAIITLSDTDAHITSISNIKVLPYMRFKLIGGASNDASTTVKIFYGRQENV